MATYYLDPNSTISNTFDIVGAPTAHQAIDGGTRQPTAPGGTESLKAPLTESRTGRFGCATFTPGSGEAVSSVKGWAYTAFTTSYWKVGIYINGVQKALSSLLTGLGWDSVTWSSGSLTQAEIDGLEIHLENTAGATDGHLYGAYLEVTTSLPTPYFSDRAGAYNVLVSRTLQQSGQYAVIKTLLLEKQSDYMVLMTRTQDAQARYFALLRLTKDLQARYVIDSIAFSVQTALFFILPGDLETPPAGATDISLKGPLSLYITVAGTLKKLPDWARALFRGDDIVYTWAYKNDSGTFKYRQDL